MVHRIKYDFITTPSKIWGYHIRVAEHTHLLGCDPVFLGVWFLAFQTIVYLHVQGLSSPRMLDPKDKYTTTPHNVSNCSNKGTTNPGQLVPSLQSAHEGDKVVSTMHRPTLPPQEIFLVLISVRGSVNRRSIVLPEGLCHWKIPMMPSGIETATFRLVARCLNQLRWSVPHVHLYWTYLHCHF